MLKSWIVDALEELDGEATIVQVAYVIWRDHEDDLRAMGDLFYTWQYDMRWAAQTLRDGGTLVKLHGQRIGLWVLSPDADGRPYGG